MKIKLISKYKPKLYFLGKIYQCQIGLAGVVSKFQKKKKEINLHQEGNGS